MWKINFFSRINNHILTTFDERFKITWVPFSTQSFIPRSCQLGNFKFKVLCWVILCWYFIKAKQIHSTATGPSEIFKIVSFTSSIIKNIVVFLARSRFPVTLNCCIAFWAAYSTCFLLASMANSLQWSLK